MDIISNIDSVYENYINLDVKQIDKYMKSIFKQYNINSIDYIMDMLCEHAENLEKEEYKKFQEKQKKIRFYHSEIIKLIDEYLKNDSLYFLFELLKCNDIGSLNVYLQFYLNINPKRKLEIEYLKDQLNEINQKLNKVYIYKQYLESNESEQSIVNLITLIFCKDENDAITLLDKYHFSKDEYELYLNKFERIFPNQKYGLKYLEAIYKKYLSTHLKQIDDPTIKKNLKLIEDMFVSEYSVLEYLSHNGGYTIKKMDKIFSEIKGLNIPKYKKMIDALNDRSNEKLFEYLDNLVLKIYESDNFELIDYYNYTKLSIEYFKKYVSNHVDDIQVKKDVTKKLCLIWNFSSIHLEVIEKSIKGISIIKGVTVSVEEKQKIYIYLKENGIPVLNNVFNYYIRKYAAGELDLKDNLVQIKKL